MIVLLALYCDNNKSYALTKGVYYDWWCLDDDGSTVTVEGVEES